MISPTKKWIFIKFSSLLSIPLMIWFTFIIAGIYDKKFVGGISCLEKVLPIFIIFDIETTHNKLSGAEERFKILMTVILQTPFSPEFKRRISLKDRSKGITFVVSEL